MFCTLAHVQAVCSVAGLCNNAHIDRLLEEAAAITATATATKHQSVVPLTASPAAPFTCSKCNSIAGIMSQRFHGAKRDDVLDWMLTQCRGMSTFSDACANIALTYFDEIYANLKSTVNKESICHMSGVCSARFHQHDDETATDITVERLEMGISPSANAVNDDIPCELCKQLVHHLKYV